MNKQKIESGAYLYESEGRVYRADKTSGGWKLYLVAGEENILVTVVKSLKIIEIVLNK